MGHQTFVEADGIRHCDKHDAYTAGCFACHIAGGGSDD